MASFSCAKQFYHLTKSLPNNDDLIIVGVMEDGTLTSAAHHPWHQSVTGLHGQWKKKTIYLADRNILFVPIAAQLSAPCTKWQEAGGLLWSQTVDIEKATLMIDGLPASAARALLFGLGLKSWRFSPYRTSARPLQPAKQTNISAVTPYADTLDACISKDRAIINAVHWGRHMANEPGNVIYPETFVNELKSLTPLGVKLTILDQNDMKNKGFGALLGVAQGSEKAPYLAILEWNGNNHQGPAPIALVGKGVTFDSGGLSIKPSSGMEDMKMDKTGAVVVCATLRALAEQKADVHVMAVVALVENMPSGSAQRPGDIVRSLSGQTIEVLNTDAEGRLILADALWYVQDAYKPKIIIDVATLTGAVRGALGPVYAGLFSNDDALVSSLLEAGKRVGEKLWQLPLHDAYDKALNSTVADMRNITEGGFGGGASTAAQFLKRFIQSSTRWAHLDIASVDHVKEEPLCPKGASAFGIRLLVDWILHHDAQD